MPATETSFRRPQSDPLLPTLTLTIAICTWNRAKTLDLTLSGFQHVRVPEGISWEILVVNNNSTDETDDVAFRHQLTLPLRRLFEPNPGVVNARNRALKEAKGEIILWTDDDVEVPANWVEKYIEAFQHFHADLVFGPIDPLWEGKKPQWYIPECHGLFALLDLGGEARVVTNSADMGFNVNLGVRRSALNRIGMYRVDGTGRVGGGEDIDLFRRAYAAGLTVVYQPEARILHRIPPHRSEKAFHRRGAWRGSEYHLGLLRNEARTEHLPTILGIPRYFIRYNAQYLLSYIKSLLTFDRGRTFFYELKLLRMLALLRLILLNRVTMPTQLQNTPDTAAVRSSDSSVSLSVIMPTYNRASYVRECLLALQKSGVHDLEIIVTDDGSTDNTREVVAETDPDAKYIWQENTRTPSTARNAALNIAHGRYIGFLDCDDLWLPEAPARAVEFLDRHPEVDVLFAEANVGNPSEGYTSWIEMAGQATFWDLPAKEPEPGFRILERGPFFRRMAVRNAVFIGACIVRREALEKVGRFDPALCGAADWELWLRMANSLTFAFMKEPLAIYTRHPDNMSGNQDSMVNEFAMALRNVLKKCELSNADRQLVKDRLRHHLFHHAYLAYDAGKYSVARKRFNSLIGNGAITLRNLAYWALCHLPGSWIHAMRKIKQGKTKS